MNTSYNFLSDEEPTEEQLAWLMQQVLVEVKVRAAKAEEKYMALHLAETKRLLQEWRLKHAKNESK